MISNISIALVLLCLVVAHGYVRRPSLLMMASKYMSSAPVFVAGGSSGVGLLVVEKLSAAGTPVKVLVRREDAKEMLDKMPGVSAEIGDASDEAAVQNCMNGCIAAITLLGGAPLTPSDEQSERIDYIGNSNVVEQAGILGVERIIMVTSVGCGDTINAIPTQVYRTLEKALTAKSKAERDLKTYTNLDWTIIRPGGLKNGDATGTAILTEDIMASGAINREDVANFIIQVLASSGSCTRRELTAIDPTMSEESITKVVPFKF